MAEKMFMFLESFDNGRIRLNEGGKKRNIASSKGKALESPKRGGEGIVKFI